MSTLGIVAIVVCSVLAELFIAVRVIKGGFLGATFKILASVGFTIFAIIGISQIMTLELRMVASFLASGLTLGMVGDIVLDLKVLYDNDQFYLNIGMLSFGLGHIFYFVAFTLYAGILNIGLLLPIIISTAVSIVLTIVIIIMSRKVIKLDFGKYLIQTIIYTFMLTFMAVYSIALAIGGANILLPIGMIIFLLSDIVLSLQYFGGKIKNKYLITANHLLYYGAQIVLMAFIFVL